MMTAADKFTWTSYDTLLRLDFVSFAQRCLRELSPRAQFAMNWHIEIIAAKLMALRAGKIRRLIINMPPRYLKSLLASVAFPAWCLGHDPAAQILCASYAQELADKLSRDCRRILPARNAINFAAMISMCQFIANWARGLSSRKQRCAKLTKSSRSNVS